MTPVTARTSSHTGVNPRSYDRKEVWVGVHPKGYLSGLLLLKSNTPNRSFTGVLPRPHHSVPPFLGTSPVVARPLEPPVTQEHSQTGVPQVWTLSRMGTRSVDPVEG